MQPTLSDKLDIREVGAPITAGSSTDSNSDRIDMAGFEGVIFVTTITDSVSTGVATLTVEQNTADSDTGMAAIAGAAASATSAANDDLNGQILMAEVHRPRERYVQAVRTSATANMAFGSCFAILYGARTCPVELHSTIAAAVRVTSAAEA